MTEREQDIDATIRASIALTATAKGRTLTPDDIAAVRRYLVATPWLTPAQARFLGEALCESHERLRVERIVKEYGL